MLKKLFAYAALVLFITACGTATQKADQLAVITVKEFTDNPDQYTDKEIKIEGTVSHVCKHGGKRLFLVADGVEDNVKVETGDEISTFPVEIEGSDVLVTGKVEKLVVDEAYLTNWENEVKANNPESDFKIHEGQVGHESEEGDPAAEFEQINNLRNQIKESGSDHLTFFTLRAKKYEEKQDKDE